MKEIQEERFSKKRAENTARGDQIQYFLDYVWSSVESMSQDRPGLKAVDQAVRDVDTEWRLGEARYWYDQIVQRRRTLSDEVRRLDLRNEKISHKTRKEDNPLNT